MCLVVPPQPLAMVVFLHLLVVCGQVELATVFRVQLKFISHPVAPIDNEATLSAGSEIAIEALDAVRKFRRSTTLSSTKLSRASTPCARGALSTSSQYRLERMSRSVCEALGLRRLTVLETMVLIAVMITGISSMSTVTLTKVILGTGLSYVTIHSLPFLERAVDRFQG